MSIQLAIELADASVDVTRVDDFALDIDTAMPSVEFGVPGPQGIQGERGDAGADAVDIDFTPAGGISSANVQAALEELDAEKPTKAYVDSHGVYVGPTPPPDPTQWAIWVNTS